jgi:AraC-like DNA-binding protein
MRGTDFKIAKIAKDVGYASESAFTKAFHLGYARLRLAG